MTQVFVKLAEVQIVQGEAQFMCVGLGSCVGVALYDPKADVAGVAHVMLPEVIDSDSRERPGKYANVAIPHLLTTMENLGADRSNIVAAIAGGAQVCFGKAVSTTLALGARNTQAVKKELELAGVECMGSDVGGNAGRTFTFESGSGRVLVRTTSSDRILCRLK